MAALRPLIAAILALWLGAAADASDAAPGRIEGRVVGAENRGLEGVTVVLDDAAATLTDQAGRYRFTAVESGEHALVLTLGERVAQDTATVRAGEATAVETRVDWQLAFAETITVKAASRRTERIIEAPAAVTVLTAAEIERRSASDQLPRLLAQTPGVELTQSGLYDFNLNVRGFNGTTNRRLLVLIDGRDPSLMVFSGSQEWANLTFSLDDLERAEMVRGPGAALYGAGAFNGVLSLTTKAPRDHRGGRLRLTGGSLDTGRVDGSYATAFGDNTFVKVLGSYQESDDFARSRTADVEYAPQSLPREAIPLLRDRIETYAGALRLDRHLDLRRFLTLEAGTARSRGVTVVSGLGRIQRTDPNLPWARALLSAPHWQLSASYTGRDSTDVSLSSGAPIVLDAYRISSEIQGNIDFARGRGELTGGASYIEQRADSADVTGRSTLFPQVVRSDHQAIFGQVRYGLTDKLEAVLSLRWDDSNLHDTRLSPRLALVYGISPQHTLRLSFGEGFQSPALAEKFIEVPAGLPLDLSPLEDQLTPVLGGVRLGFENVPLLAVGRDNLDVEEIESLELGYTGILNDRLLLNVNLYANELRNFTTNLVPVVGTSLGQLGSFPAYEPPSTLSSTASDAVLQALRDALPGFLLAGRADGSLYIPFLSFGNFGEVDTRGLELALNWRHKGWQADFSWSYFDFEIRRQAPENPLSPNRPQNQLTAGISRIAERYSVSLEARWSEDFLYRSGIFNGPVPSYTVSDLHAHYTIAPHWDVGLDVANVFDKVHYEVFGGDLLRRRSLLYVSYRW